MHDARLAARPSNGNGRVQHTHTQTNKALHHSCTQKPIEKNSGRFLHDKNRSVHRKDRQKSEHFRKIGASGSPAIGLRVRTVLCYLAVSDDQDGVCIVFSYLAVSDGQDGVRTVLSYLAVSDDQNST